MIEVVPVADLHSELLFDSSLVRVGNVVCWAPRSGPADAQWVATARIVLPRRGVFRIHHAGRPIVADANTVVLFGSESEYRVSHPADGGDECTVLVFPPSILADALGSDAIARSTCSHTSLREATQLACRMLSTSLHRGFLDRFEAEEAALLLLDALVGDFAQPAAAGAHRIGQARPVWVEDVRALLAAQPAAPWRLDAVAQAVHYSPFHLARQFRAATGMSVHRYLVRLRLGLALDRMAQGETRLAVLAADLGFAHHSHFTASFRSVFGVTPRAAQATLTCARLSQLRKILTATPGSTR